MNDKAQHGNKSNNENYSSQDRLGILELTTQRIKFKHKREIK